MKYGEQDFMLIRTTDYLSEDHILRPVSEIPFLTKIYGIARTGLFRVMQEQTKINPFSDPEGYEKLKEFVDSNSPLSTQYRSTIHFSLNGLVTGDNGKGNFDGRSFVIIDRLDKHLDDNIKSIRMEDTYFKDDFKISDEATILIEASMYEKLKEANPWLDTYNVVLYQGSQKDAVDNFLKQNNIIPEEMEAHSAKESERTPLYQECLDKIALEHNISREPHFHSKEYKEDDAKSLALWKIYEKNFFEKIATYFNLDLQVIDILSGFGDVQKKEALMKDIILKIGIDNYVKFVQDYNDNLKERVKKGMYPTNNEILASGTLDTFEEKTM